MKMNKTLFPRERSFSFFSHSFSIFSLFFFFLFSRSNAFRIRKVFHPLGRRRRGAACDNTTRSRIGTAQCTPTAVGDRHPNRLHPAPRWHHCGAATTTDTIQYYDNNNNTVYGGKILRSSLDAAAAAVTVFLSH